MSIRLTLKRVNMPPQKKIKVSISEVELKEETSMKKETEKHDADSNTDWRTENWHSRNHFALVNSILCDVSFDVGLPQCKKVFKAHKLILALSSPVFEAMFYGQLAEVGTSISIPDIAPEAFEALLHFIYTGDVVLTSLDLAFQLWIAADKYCVPHIKAKCEQHFEDCSLCSANIWSSYQTALFLGIKTLVEKCEDYFGKNSEKAMLQEDFTSISLDTMCSFLSLSRLSAPETTLLTSVMKWGEAQKDIPLDEAVKPCLKLIRFSCLSQSEFCKFLDTWKGVISDADALAIMKHLSDYATYSLPDWCSQRTWRRSSNFDSLLALKFGEKSANSTSSDSSSDTSTSSSCDSESSNQRRRKRRSRRWHNSDSSELSSSD